MFETATTKMSSNPFSNWNQKFKKTNNNGGTQKPSPLPLPSSSSWISGSFNPNKLKVHLKLAIHRFQMASNKKSALLKQNMREIAVFLAEEPPKEEKARIKVESLIREDYMIEAYDILSLNCELLSERMKLLQLTKTCPADLVSSIATVMYAAPRIDGIPELAVIRQQFINKYGKQFDRNVMSNVNGVVNERVVTKLSIQPPAAYLVQTYLEQICDKYEVDWSPLSNNFQVSAEQMGEPIAAPTGYSIPIGNGTGLGPKYIGHTGMTVNGDDNDDDDDDDEPLPPYHPYSGGLVATNTTTRSTYASLPSPNIPGGGGGDATINRSINNTTQSSRHQQYSSASSAVTGQPTSPSPSSRTIPEAPSSFIIPVAPDMTSSSTSNKCHNNDNDDDDNNSPPPLPSSSFTTTNTTTTTGRDTSSVSASYGDMAARFEALKNL